MAGQCFCEERLWRSLKYEEVYLKAYESVVSAKEGAGQWAGLYNERRRPHQGLDMETPDQVYYGVGFAGEKVV